MAILTFLYTSKIWTLGKKEEKNSMAEMKFLTL